MKSDPSSKGGNMKKKILISALIVGFACVFFGSGMYVGAATKTGAGSQNDPVVSMSYLEYRLEKLGKGGSSDDSGTTGGYEKVTLEYGERLIPGEGGVIIVYSGSCTAVGKGLVDLKDAKMIQESSGVPAYSQMLAPDSSSGVVASEKAVVFVIRGK